ncbi:MAG TPA: YaeQ family protein [Malonomonas sp.]
MAIKATIFKALVQISDMDRNYYNEHQLTLARHPSETDERMMVRLLAFALHADERLEFTKGLCAEDEAEIWQRSYSDEIELWIDVGQPDDNRIRKACNRAKQVIVYSYGRSAGIWWQRLGDKLLRHDNLRVINLPESSSKALATLARRSMELHISIQDGLISLGDDTQNLMVETEVFR